MMKVLDLAEDVVLQEPACVDHLQRVSILDPLALPKTQILNHHSVQ